MSKRNKRQYRPQPNQPNQTLDAAPQAQPVTDAFQNQLARLGWGMPNLMEATSYPMTRMTQNYQLINSLYRGNWIIRRIIDVKARDTIKKWITLNSEITPEMQQQLDRQIHKTKTRSGLLDGLKWGDLYGGAGAIMLIDGHEDLSEPLNLDLVMPGSYRGLLVRDRWSGVYPETELVEDINSPDYGLPKYYKFDTQNGTSFTVHHSRLLRFTGADLPLWEKQAEMYWGESEVEIIFEELKKRDNTSANIAMLVFMANLRVLTKDDLAEALAIGNQKLQNSLYQVIQAQNWLMNNMSMQVIGPKDKFETFQYTFSGLNDIYESFMLDIAGAAEMPVTKIFGRSPQGMNATGESDAQNYSNMIAARQDERARPVMDKLLPVIAMSTWGYVPDDITDYDFNPIEELNDKEKSEVAEKDTNTTIAGFNAGIIGRQTALKELRQLGNATGRWTNITDEVIAQADDNPVNGDLMPGLNDLMGYPGGGELSNALRPVGADPANRNGISKVANQANQPDNQNDRRLN